MPGIQHRDGRSVDRLSRSVTDLSDFLTEIHALKIDLYLHSQGLDTSTPMGKAMFQIAGVFAELKRSILKERIMARIARARDKGTKGGKPIGRPRVPAQVEAAIAKALQQGKHGIHKIAAKHSVGVGVVQLGSRPPCEYHSDSDRQTTIDSH